MRPIDYIVESVTMQGDGKNLEAHQGMIDAFVLTKRMRQQSPTFTVVDIQMLAAHVTGSPHTFLPYRDLPASFADGSLAIQAPFILRQMDLLVENMEVLTPEEFYRAFETIHPFFDGNGRVGSLLFNFLNGTIDDPIHPPEFKRNQ